MGESNKAVMDRDDAEEYTQALGQVVSGGWRQIALGERLGVPAALGLSTREWVDQRLGGYVRMSIPERREAVAELTAEGLTTRQAADVLGVSHTTIERDARPEPELGTDVPEPEPEPDKQQAEPPHQPELGTDVPEPERGATYRPRSFDPGAQEATEDDVPVREVDPEPDPAPPVSPEALSGEETSLAGVDLSLMAASPEPGPQVDERARRQWTARFQQIAGAVQLMEQPMPTLPEGQFLDLTVMSARELARKLTDATARWMRDINAAYAERIGDTQDV